MGGAWLPEDSLTTLIDDHSAYPAIVAIRSAARRVLPPAQDFKVPTTLHLLLADQIALPDPNSSIEHADRLNQSFPLLYCKGRTGYMMSTTPAGGECTGGPVVVHCATGDQSHWRRCQYLLLPMAGLGEHTAVNSRIRFG